LQSLINIIDYEKIRFISNPDEVAQVCGIVYNLQNEELEVQQQVEDIKTNAYNFITKWNWKDISKKMELIIINTL
jgi:hypothetical protein